MRREGPSAIDLVRTQADQVPPPEMPAAGPRTRPNGGALEERFDPGLLVEIKNLSDRVGGLEKLRELIETLMRIQE
jgi:hypothetical protein